MEDQKEFIKVSPKISKLRWDDPQVLGIIAAVVVVLLTIILFSLYRRSKNKRSGVLLVGLCDSGKTAIYAQLVYGTFVHTHTSVKENMGEYICGNYLMKIIDIPGHERLRNRYFDEFKSTARGLVFVVDSLTVQKDIKDVAEYLYNCLSDATIMSNTPPMLILCNKQDETMAKGSAAIKTLLEKEMNILRKTKGSQLESIDKSHGSVILGKDSKDFEFAHLSPMKINFAEMSAVSSEDKSADLSVLTDWLYKLQ